MSRVVWLAMAGALTWVTVGCSGDDNAAGAAEEAKADVNEHLAEVPDTPFCDAFADGVRVLADVVDPDVDRPQLLVAFKVTYADLAEVAPEEISADAHQTNEAVADFDDIAELLALPPEVAEASARVNEYASANCNVDVGQITSDLQEGRLVPGT